MKKDKGGRTTREKFGEQFRRPTLKVSPGLVGEHAPQGGLPKRWHKVARSYNSAQLLSKAHRKEASKMSSSGVKRLDKKD